jgi:hypothetical protein
LYDIINISKDEREVFKMGYDSKLVIIKKSRLFADPDCNNKVWAEKIAEVRLCVVDNEVYSKIKDYPITNSYYYEHLIDEPIIKDMYDEELREIPLDDCIAMLETANKTEYYRRYTIALGLLKSFNTNDWCDGEIVVLHYGY